MRLVRPTALFLLGLVMAASTGAPASAQTWTGTQSADELRYRLSVIDAELATIRAQLGQMDSGDGSAAAGAAAGAGASQLEIGRLQAEIQRLTGQVERLGFRLDKIAEDATRRFGDIEFRLTELEGGDPSQIGAVAPLGGQPAVSSPELSDPGSVAATSGPALATATPQVSISEREELQRAIKDIEQGRFDQGEDRIRRFLNSYPNSPLEGEALYWLAESQFVRGEFQDAARSYLNGYNADRRGPAAARNLMKLGVTLGRLGQQNEACLTLREVTRQFPNAPADVSQQAAEAAAALSCS